ncbi:unnamed protein product [Aphanomyces euteiches]
MASTASPMEEFDLDESEVLFGVDPHARDWQEEDDELVGVPEIDPIQDTTTKIDKKVGKATGMRHIDSFDSLAIRKPTQRFTQSQSMPEPSSGFLHSQWWNNKEPLDDDCTTTSPASMLTRARMAGIPIQSSAPTMHWRSTSIEDGDDNEFVPPHQMVERDCFSLGMKHYFKHKPCNI